MTDNSKRLYWKWGLPAVLVLLVWFASGWQQIPADHYVVRDSSWLKVEPRLLENGWHWLASGVFQTRSFPHGPQRRRWQVGLDGPPLVSPEGARLAAVGELVWAVDPAQVHRLAALSSGDVDADVVRPAVAELLGPRLMAGDDLVADPEAGEMDLVSGFQAAGLLLDSFAVDDQGPPAALSSAMGRRATQPGIAGPVLLVGWDGADWNTIDPLLTRGEMPNLQRLISTGTRGRLRTVAPVLSPVIWTSVATGTMPVKHGIIDFLAVDPATGGRIPVTSNLRRMPALWTLLEQRGLDVGVVGWWATWPAEAVRGYMVTDRIAYQLFGMGEDQTSGGEGKTWPAELYADLKHLMVRPEQVTTDELAAFAPGLAGAEPLPAADATLLNEFKTVVAATRTYHDIAMTMAERQRPALQAVYYEASDTAAHLFMPFQKPRMPAIEARRVELWGEVVAEVYRDLDRRLGELVAAAGAETTLVLVSDHGFRSGENRPAADARIGGGRAAEWHRKYGILVISGPGARLDGHVGDPSVVDVAPTILALMGLPVPAFMDGKVLTQALNPAHLEAYPVLLQGQRRILTAQTVAAPLPSTADQAIVERLRSLGYIGTEEVDRLRQNDPTGYNNRAALLLAQGNGADALQELERGLLLAPTASALLINKARALRLLRRDDEALSLLLEVLEREPSLTPVENLIGNIYMDRGDLDQAAEYFEHGLSVDGNATDLLISRGLLLERRGQLNEALETYRRASDIDPDSAEAWNNMGNVHRRQAVEAQAAGQVETAKAAFERASEAYRQGMQADPEFIGSYNNLALVYQETGRLEQAVALYERALEQEPEQAVVHNNLGSLYVSAGRLKDAFASFQRALEDDPEYASAWNNLGAVHGMLGRPEDELDAYRKAIELDPSYADGHHNLGLALLRRGQLEEAESALRQAIELKPDYVSALVALASLNLSRENPSAAVAYLQTAVGINPRQPSLFRHLGEALLAAGRRPEAVEAFRRSLQLDPQQESVAERLRQLNETF